MTTGGGRLIVVGTGIQTVGQLTGEARAWMSVADEVLHLIPDPVGEAIVERLAPGRNHGLRSSYVAGRPRGEAYRSMLERILRPVRAGRTVCAAFYGHPGVCALAPHEAVAAARSEGYPAQMLPAVSALDCLFADLGVDPVAVGCTTYEASDFVLNHRMLDPSAALVLWQIGKVGVYTASDEHSSPAALEAVTEKLASAYPRAHPVVLYQASTRPRTRPSVTRLYLGELPTAATTGGHTLYVGPAEPVRPDPRYAHLGP